MASIESYQAARKRDNCNVVNVPSMVNTRNSPLNAPAMNTDLIE